MSEIGEEEVCELVCSQTLDGYTPNPLYTSGACPDYMKSECNADGTLWQKQWDLHQDRLKLFNSDRLFHASLGIPTQAVSYNQRDQESPVLPPTSAQVFAMVQSQQQQQTQQQMQMQMQIQQQQMQQQMQQQQIQQQIQQQQQQQQQKQRFY